MSYRTYRLLSAALIAGATPAFAETPAGDVASQIAELKAQLQAQSSELQQLRNAQGDTWLNERRAEEVKGLIREVLADADTRASLMQDGVLAGHDGKKFFLKSADDSFLLNVEGQITARYIVNYQEDRADEVQNGFQMRYVKLALSGHIGAPEFGYYLQINAEREEDAGLGITDGDLFLEDAIISYNFTDELKLQGGRMKLPFLRQELISDKRQLAVERSSVNRYFTLGRAEQIQLNYTGDAFEVLTAISDGANSAATDFQNTPAELALTARANLKLAGEWTQMGDEKAWGEDFALFLGGAVHYEDADEDNTGASGDYFAYTVDGLVKSGNFAGLAAFHGANADDELGGPEDAYGFLVEGGYSVTEKLQPFARWEYIDVDGAGEALQFATIGVNYYFKSHAAKFTTDLVWKYAGDNPATLGTLGGGELSSAAGLVGAGVNDDDQFALRAQFQLLF